MNLFRVWDFYFAFLFFCIQSRVRSPQIEVRRLPTVGLATAEFLNLFIPTSGNLLLKIVNACSDNTPKISRYCSDSNLSISL